MVQNASVLEAEFPNFDMSAIEGTVYVPKDLADLKRNNHLHLTLAADTCYQHTTTCPVEFHPSTTVQCIKAWGSGTSLAKHMKQKASQ